MSHRRDYSTLVVPGVIFNFTGLKTVYGDSTQSGEFVIVDELRLTYGNRSSRNMRLIGSVGIDPYFSHELPHYDGIRSV